MSNKVLTEAYSTLNDYVRRVRFGGTFDTNTLRTRLNKVRGLTPNQVAGVISHAVRRGVIYRIGKTRSTDPNHNGGPVGVYERGYGKL